MTYSGSVYFLGSYRPAHFEAPTIEKLTYRMFQAIANMDNCEWLIESIEECERNMRKPSCASVAIDHCSRGVSMAKRPHDPWLDDMVADMPICPGLDYSTAVNG